MASTAAAGRTIETVSPGFDKKFEALFARLATNGIEIGIRERVIAGRIVAELAVQQQTKIPDDQWAFLLLSWLTPLLAKSSEDVEQIRRVFLDVFRPPDAQLTPSPYHPQHSPVSATIGPRRKARVHRRIRNAAIAGLVLLLTVGAVFGIRWLFSPPTATVQPDEQTGTTTQDHTTQQPTPNVVTATAQQLTSEEIEKLTKQIIDAASGSRIVTIRELARRLSSGSNTRELISLLQRYVSRPPDKPFTLTALELTHLINALAARQYMGRAATSEAVTAIASAGLDALGTHDQHTAFPPLSPPMETVFTPSWLTGCLLAVPAIPFVWWVLGRRKRLKDYLRRRTPERPPLVHELVVRASVDIVRERTTLTRASLRLGRARQGLSRTLDVEATALATAQAAGLPHLVFAPNRSSPEYLVLISTKGREDHGARQLDQLAMELASQNLLITRYFIAHDANLCFESPEASYFRLDELAALYPEHRLIFLGNGDQLLNPATLAAWPWVEDLKAWPRRAILTPKPVEEWGRHEAALARLFDSPPLRANSVGLLRLAELFERQEGPDPEKFAVRRDQVRRTWTLRPQRWLSPVPPDSRAVEQLQDELTRYFVDDRGNLDETALWWLAACAIYPALRWDLTVYLGLKLNAPRADGTAMPFYNEERALRLVALPWFREGFMPDWLRRRLLVLLPKDVDAQAAWLLHDLLERAVKSENQAFDAMRLRVALDQPDPVAARPDRDEIFLDALAGSDPLALPAPPSVRQSISGVRNAFVAREWATLVIIAVYWVGTALIVPWPSSGALTTTAFLPLFFLPFVLVTWPLARRVVSWVMNRADGSAQTAPPRQQSHGN